jgi:SPP1 gp7 family putative phage head morphogenesis protein
MRSAQYWQRRSEQIAMRQFRRADGYEAALRREYDRAIASIKRDIEAFYGRFAIDNQVSYAEARKLLTIGELREFRMSLDEFIAKAKDNADGRWTRELSNAYYRTRVSRLEALQTQIYNQVEMLTVSKEAAVRGILGEAYTDTYYRTLYEIQRGTGIGASFARVDDQALKKVLGTKLDGKNWSERIWEDRNKLREELHTKLAQGFIRGDSVDRMSRELAERMNVSYSRAKTLVHTETAFFTEQATMDSYRESGVVDRYEILATLDNRTSEICRAMDGKVFRVSEQEPGVNAPPFHPNCRTTTVPYFDDEIDVGERFARDPDGQAYYVPGDTTYEQWKKQYVDSPGLASGDGKRDNDGDQLRFVQKIEPREIPEAVQTYEGVIRHAEVENAYVIRPDGEVLTKSGTAEWIGFTEDELAKMKGATVTHNHPTNTTQWSFSREDIELFIESGMKELRATDERYTYSLSGQSQLNPVELRKAYEEAQYKALDLIIQDGYDFEEIDYYRQHEVVKMIAKQAGITYRRWLNG